jgi:hypothetical protein
MKKKDVINNIIMPFVDDIRNRELSSKYNIYSKKYYNYKGLCNEASQSFINRINKLNQAIGSEIYCKMIHGELRHTPRVKSEYWSYEHTWVVMIIDKYTFYIDITSSQFKWLFKDIPDYYISTREPKWYLPDYENIEFSKLKICKWLMDIKVFRFSSNKFKMTMPLPIFYIYKIWAPISDLIHQILFK